MKLELHERHELEIRRKSLLNEVQRLKEEIVKINHALKLGMSPKRETFKDGLLNVVQTMPETFTLTELREAVLLAGIIEPSDMLGARIASELSKFGKKNLIEHLAKATYRKTGINKTQT